MWLSVGGVFGALGLCVGVVCWGRVSSRLGLDLLDFLDVPDLLDSLDVPWIYCIY